MLLKTWQPRQAAHCHPTTDTCQAERQPASHTVHFPAQDAAFLIEAVCLYIAGDMQLTTLIPPLTRQAELLVHGLWSWLPGVRLLDCVNLGKS